MMEHAVFIIYITHTELKNFFIVPPPSILIETFSELWKWVASY